MDGKQRNIHASKITEATLMALAEGGETIIIDKDAVTHYIEVDKTGVIKRHVSFPECPILVVPELIETLNVGDDVTKIKGTTPKVYV